MKKIIEIKKDEYWYGGAVNDGFRFPLTSDSQYFIDMTYNDKTRPRKLFEICTKRKI